MNWQFGITSDRNDNDLIVCFYQVRQKSNPLKLFAVFSATAWIFCVKFYIFTWLSYLHLNAKWLLTIFKYDEVIAVLAWPISDFHVLKNVCAEIPQNRVTETTQSFLF